MTSNERNGLMPSAWGPAFWHVLYTWSANYSLEPTPEQMRDAALFLHSISRALPCRKCRENFPRNAREAGLGRQTFKNRHNLFAFVYQLHTSVSRALGKQMTFTLAEAQEMIESFRAKCNASPEVHNGCQEPIAGTKKPCLKLVVE